MKHKIIFNTFMAVFCIMTTFSCRIPETPPTPPTPPVEENDTTPTFEPSGNVIIDIVNECDYIIGKQVVNAEKIMSYLGWTDVSGSFGYLTKIDEANGIEFAAMPCWNIKAPNDTAHSTIFKMQILVQAYGDSSILNYDNCRELIRQVGDVRHLYSGIDCKFKALAHYNDSDLVSGNSPGPFACDIEECIDNFLIDDIFITAGWFATDDEFNAAMSNVFPTILGNSLPKDIPGQIHFAKAQEEYSYFMLDYVKTDYEPYYTISITIHNRDFE